eukprot:gene20870-27711_t
MAMQNCISLLVIASTAFASVTLLMRVERLSKSNIAHRHGEPKQLDLALRTAADLAVGHCDLCADNWLFILGMFRTGSSTALAMLDSIPGIELRGEHGGFLNLQGDQFKDLAEAEVRVKEGSTAWSFEHEADFHYLKCSAQHMTKGVIFGQDAAKMLGQTKVMGFKEIRHTSIKSLRFIMSLFPCARFVFTYRENWNVSVNAPLPSKQHEKLRQDWRKWKRLVYMVHERFGNTTALLPVENLSASSYTEVVQGLLGLRGCRFTTVLHENKNGSGTLRNQIPGSPLEASCETSTVDFRLSEERVEANIVAWDALEEAASAGCHARRILCD